MHRFSCTDRFIRTAGVRPVLRCAGIRNFCLRCTGVRPVQRGTWSLEEIGNCSHLAKPFHVQCSETEASSLMPAAGSTSSISESRSSSSSLKTSLVWDHRVSYRTCVDGPPDSGINSCTIGFSRVYTASNRSSIETRIFGSCAYVF